MNTKLARISNIVGVILLDFSTNKTHNYEHSKKSIKAIKKTYEYKIKQNLSLFNAIK